MFIHLDPARYRQFFFLFEDGARSRSDVALTGSQRSHAVTGALGFEIECDCGLRFLKFSDQLWCKFFADGVRPSDHHRVGGGGSCRAAAGGIPRRLARRTTQHERADTEQADKFGYTDNPAKQRRGTKMCFHSD